MSTVYTKSQTLQALATAVRNDITKLYAAPCINWSGTTSDCERDDYTNVIANEILKTYLSPLKSIQVVSRKESYCIGHQKVSDWECSSQTQNRSLSNEKWIAKYIFQEEDFLFLGSVIDYETPLGNYDGDGLGEIDLLTVNDNTLYAIELKSGANENDTLLHAILQAYTYAKIVDKVKLIKNFRERFPWLPPTPDLIPAVAVFQDSPLYKNSEGLEKVEKLRNELGVKLFLLSWDDDGITVESGD